MPVTLDPFITQELLHSKDFYHEKSDTRSEFYMNLMNRDVQISGLMSFHARGWAKRVLFVLVYLENIKAVNNWNLVDASAHHIIGAHTFNTNKTILIELAKSNVMWERRIAIVATWYFIRKNQFLDTLKIARPLLHDTHDLIHKSVGWMLRGMGKRDEKNLVDFLGKNSSIMSRTMLRYAIEKFSAGIRKKYLQSCNCTSVL